MVVVLVVRGHRRGEKRLRDGEERKLSVFLERKDRKGPEVRTGRLGMSASRALLNGARAGAVRGQAGVEVRREHTCGALGPVAMETPPP